MAIKVSPTAKGAKPSEIKDLSSYIRDLRDMYSQDVRQTTFNSLILGEVGAGKTHLAKTARKPVLIHSFDPGGTKHLKKEIAAGEIIVDTRWENDDPKSPHTYRDWEKEFESLVASGVLEGIGTFMLDSFTVWLSTLKAELARKKGRAEGVLQLQDWQVLGNIVKDFTNVLTDLPCDTIMTGHLTLEKDEISGRMKAKIDTINSLQNAIPVLFDEIYILEAEETSGGIQRSLITANTGKFQARTRIGSEVFETREDPDIKALLRKAGLPDEDKIITEETEEDA